MIRNAFPHHRFRAGAATCLFLLVVSAPLHASTTIEVTTTADEVIVDGRCSLREAVMAANTNMAVDSCPGGSDVDTIVLPAGTYLLSRTGPEENLAQTGDLDIRQAVILRGAGAQTTVIDGGSLEHPIGDRVLEVLSGARLNLSGVTVRGGRCFSGGGILNSGWLFVSASRIEGNVTADGYTLCGVLDAVGGGAGIYNRGQLVLTWSTVSGNRALGTTGVFDAASYGGGLRNTGAASVQNSDFAGNFAGSGGGVYNSGGLDISTSRIADNDTRFWAGGLENVGVATLRRVTVSGNVDGGIVNGDMTGRLGLLSVQNSTVSGNQSFRVPGSVTNVAGTVKIGSSTIAGNSSTLPGAGLAGPSIYLANTIVANGSDGDCERAVVSWGNNLVGDGSCGLTDPSDLPFTDPMLGPLADNGGPTPTRALLPGSPAIDRIPVQQCRPHQTGSVDQRGVARPQPDGGACDIGAYELPPPGGGGGF